MITSNNIPVDNTQLPLFIQKYFPVSVVFKG